MKPKLIIGPGKLFFQGFDSCYLEAKGKDVDRIQHIPSWLSQFKGRKVKISVEVE